MPQTLLTEEDLSRMQEGRVGTIRLVIPWGRWRRMQKDAKQVDFSSVDPILLSAAENGVRVASDDLRAPRPGSPRASTSYDCDPGCAPYAPTSDEALAAWKDFVDQLVERYGPDGDLWTAHPELDPVPVRSWQIWNEQNSPTFYQPEVYPASYERLLDTASEAIKDRDPDAEVILGGMFGTPFKGKPPALSAPDFLRQLYAIDGAREQFDAVAAHPYAAHEGKIELQVRLLHDEIERADDDAGLWITEVGASSADGPNPLDRGARRDRPQQLTDAFTFFLNRRRAWNIEGVTWYSWRDTSDPNQCDWCPGSGLFEEASLEPKPAWDAFTAFTGGS